MIKICKKVCDLSLEEKISTRSLILLVIAAYVFAVIARSIWFYQAHHIADYFWNHQLMLNNPDGYYFAAIAKDLLYHTGTFNLQIKNLVATQGLSYLTYLLVKITHFSLETIILYLPVLVSSLIVVPMILLCRFFKLTFLGFLAALLATVANTYYQRTMIGYYDTDMFAILFNLFILAFYPLSICLLFFNYCHGFYFNWNKYNKCFRLGNKNSFLQSGNCCLEEI